MALLSPSSRSTGIWVTLLFASLLMLNAGTLYGFGSYSTSLADLMGVDDVNLAGSFGDFGVYAGIFMGLFYDNFGPTYTCLLSGVLTFIGYFIPWLMLNNYITPYYSLLCIFFFLMGEGSVSMYFVALGTSCFNFDQKHRGKMMGYQHMLFAFSSMIYTLIYSQSLNSNVQNYFLLLAISLGGFNILGLLTIKKYPGAGSRRPSISETNLPRVSSSEEGDVPDLRSASGRVLIHSRSYTDHPHNNNNETDLPRTGSTSTSLKESILRPVDPGPMNAELSEKDGIEGEKSIPLLKPVLRDPNLDITGFQMMARLDFWVLFFILFLITGSGLMWKNVVGSICDSYGVDDSEVDWLVIVWSLTSTMTRLVVGVGSDWGRYKIRRPLWLIFGAVVMLVTHFIYLFGKDKVLWVVTVGTGIGYGSVWATHPTLTSFFYGMPHLSFNLGLIGFAPAFSGLIYTALASPLSDNNYTALFGLSCGGLLLSILLSAYITYIYDINSFEAPQEDSQQTN